MLKALVAALAAMALSAPVLACSCMRMERDEIISRSDAAFRARVLSVWRTGDVNTGEAGARVRVLRSYKGVRRGRILTLRTGANSAMCGIEFRKGEIVSVAASKTGPSSYSTGLCSILPD